MQMLTAAVQRLEIAVGAGAGVATGPVAVPAVTAVGFRAERCGTLPIGADWRLIAQTMGLPMAVPVFRAWEVRAWEVQVLEAQAMAGMAECRAFSPRRRPRPGSFLPSPDATAASR